MDSLHVVALELHPDRLGDLPPLGLGTENLSRASAQFYSVLVRINPGRVVGRVVALSYVIETGRDFGIRWRPLREFPAPATESVTTDSSDEKSRELPPVSSVCSVHQSDVHMGVRNAHMFCDPRVSILDIICG